MTDEQRRRQQIGAELACRKCDDEPDFLRKNRALVRRYYDELWNEWKAELIPELLAENFCFRGSLGVSARGHSGFTDYLNAVRSAFSQFHNRVESILAEDNRVVARVQYSGRHYGKIFGIEPTGNQISYAGIGIFTIGDRRLMSAWVLGDRYELMRQLGAIPEAQPLSI